jgi:hypothetical protein
LKLFYLLRDASSIDMSRFVQPHFRGVAGACKMMRFSRFDFFDLSLYCFFLADVLHDLTLHSIVQTLFTMQGSLTGGLVKVAIRDCKL